MNNNHWLAKVGGILAFVVAYLIFGGSINGRFWGLLVIITVGSMGWGKIHLWSKKDKGDTTTKIVKIPDKDTELSKKNKILLIWLAVILGSIFFYYVFYNAPQNPQSQAINSTLDNSVSNSTSAQTDLSVKQKCNIDGTSYFNNTVLPQGFPQTINKDNQQLVQQYGQQATQAWTKTMAFGNQEYSYNSKLNTCLIYYMETTTFDYNSSILTNYYIKDIYTNKTIEEYYEVDGKHGNCTDCYSNFVADKTQIMGQ